MRKTSLDSQMNHHNSAPRKYTLIFTLASAFCGLTLLAALCLALVTSVEVGQFIRDELRLRLSDVVNTMASEINADVNSRIKTAADQNTEAFKQIQNYLTRMRLRGTGIANAYTMRKTADGKIMFVVDSSEKSHTPTGEIYTDASETLKQAINTPPGTKIAFTEAIPTADNWGIWLSAYAPIYTSEGKPDGIVGIDVSATTIREHELKYIIHVYIISIIVALLMLPLGFYIARKIRRPLAQLTMEMEKVRTFALDSEVRVFSRIREIDSMVRQLENMKRGLRSFRKYMPVDLVRELIELGKEAKLGGEKKKLTIFFSDITNFTAISEHLSPEDLVGFLYEYLSVMNDCLFKNKATVDKYTGDGVMAFWGAPRNVDNPAIKACQAALLCQKKIEALHQNWKERGLDLVFHTRIGINTGEVIVGNMGSNAHMSYTVIGDNVNLTSRVETANKFYGTSILITEATYEEVKTEFVCRLIDYSVLTGKAIPIRLYELIGGKGSVDQDQLLHIEHYNSAFELYSKRKFVDAAALLEELLISTPTDHAARLLLERCNAYIITPPAPDWQGEFILPYK